MATRGPKATAKAMTASVCKVIGTGQTGIYNSVASFISITPAMTTGIELADAPRLALRAPAEEALIVCLSGVRHGIGA